MNLLHPRIILFRFFFLVGNLRRFLSCFVLSRPAREAYLNAKPMLLPIEAKALYGLALNAQAPAVIVEVGSAWGGSACILSKACGEAGKGRVYCVDIWCEHVCGSRKKIVSSLERFSKTVASFGLPELVEPICADSVDAANAWRKPIDLLFIDANHDYERVSTDIRAWVPRLAKGGVISFHDYKHTWPQVMKAVDEFLAENKGKFSQPKKANSLLWVEKL